MRAVPCLFLMHKAPLLQLVSLAAQLLPVGCETPCSCLPLKLCALWLNLLLKAHAWLMTISWGVMIPAGIVVARCFKELDPLWFKLHR